MEVQYKLCNGSKRSGRVLKVLGPAAVVRIPDPNVTVSEFFRYQYRKILEWPNMPCFLLGSWEKATYIPVELCCMIAKSSPLGPAEGEEGARKVRGR